MIPRDPLLSPIHCWGVGPNRPSLAVKHFACIHINAFNKDEEVILWSLIYSLDAVIYVRSFWFAWTENKPKWKLNTKSTTDNIGVLYIPKSKVVDIRFINVDGEFSHNNILTDGIRGNRNRSVSLSYINLCTVYNKWKAEYIVCRAWCRLFDEADPELKKKSGCGDWGGGGGDC